MDSLPLDTLGERLKAAFDAAGLSVADVAAACGISVQSVYKWLRGHSADLEGAHLVTVARITRHNPAWLEFGTPPRELVYATTEHAQTVLLAMENLSEQQAYALAQMATTLASQTSGKKVA